MPALSAPALTHSPHVGQATATTTTLKFPPPSPSPFRPPQERSTVIASLGVMADEYCIGEREWRLHNPGKKGVVPTKMSDIALLAAAVRYPNNSTNGIIVFCLRWDRRRKMGRGRVQSLVPQPSAEKCIFYACEGISVPRRVCEKRVFREHRFRTRVAPLFWIISIQLRYFCGTYYVHT